MTKEWKWRSKSGKAYLHAGCGMQDAVGAPKPSDAVPMQEGVRLLAAKGIDRWWMILTGIAALRMLAHGKRRRHKRRR